MDENSEAPDLLRMAILSILDRADRPMTAEQVAVVLGKLALTPGALPPMGKERGH